MNTADALHRDYRVTFLRYEVPPISWRHQL
jgi:hypothetical protein